MKNTNETIEFRVTDRTMRLMDVYANGVLAGEDVKWSAMQALVEANEAIRRVIHVGFEGTRNEYTRTQFLAAVK